MTEPIAVAEFVKVLTSKELKAMVEKSSPTFIVAARTKCCNTVLPFDISVAADTFLSGGLISQRGMHCNKANSNVVKICETCDVVLEDNKEKNPKCEVCGKGEFKEFVEEDISEWEITLEDVLKGCIYLERAGSFEPNHKNSNLRKLKPGCVTWNGPIPTKTKDKIPPFGLVSTSSFLKPDIKAVAVVPSFLTSKLDAILAKEEADRKKAAEEASALAISAKKKSRKAREVKISKDEKKSGFAAIDDFAKELISYKNFMGSSNETDYVDIKISSNKFWDDFKADFPSTHNNITF